MNDYTRALLTEHLENLRSNRKWILTRIDELQGSLGCRFGERAEVDAQIAAVEEELA